MGLAPARRREDRGDGRSYQRNGGGHLAVATPYNRVSADPGPPVSRSAQPASRMRRRSAAGVVRTDTEIRGSAKRSASREASPRRVVVAAR